MSAEEVSQGAVDLVLAHVIFDRQTAVVGATDEHRPYDPNSGLLHWLHIVISNAKAFILGTYHGLPKKNLQSYLDEFSFRFSRRDFGGALIERLAIAIGTSVRLS